MKKYRNKVRLKVAAAIGIGDFDADIDAFTNLDRGTLRLAKRVLNDSRLTTFYYGYRCVSDEETIKDLLKSDLDIHLKVGVVRRYLADAERTICDSAPTARELAAINRVQAE